MWILIGIVLVIVVGFLLYKNSCSKTVGTKEAFHMTDLDRLPTANVQLASQVSLAPPVIFPDVPVAKVNLVTDISEVDAGVPVAPVQQDAVQETGVSLTPGSDLPVTPDSYNEQRQSYLGSARRRGINNRLRDLPMGDLFSSPVAESVYYSRTGRPLGSMFNTNDDLQVGLVDKLATIGRRQPKVTAMGRDVPNTQMTVPSVSHDAVTGVTHVSA